jgi:hypothetical protein
MTPLRPVDSQATQNPTSVPIARQKACARFPQAFRALAASSRSHRRVGTSGTAGLHAGS